MRTPRFLCTVFLILISCSVLGAQTNSETPVDFGVWLGYKGNHELRTLSPWRLVVEGTAKRNKGILTAQAYFLQGGLGYEWKPGWQMSVGYAIQEHFPFDSASQPYKWPEQRIFEELKFPVALGNVKSDHSVSLEERWLARKSAPDYDKVTSYKFETTLKYQLRFQPQLNATTNLIVYDEVHLRLLPRDEKRFDQNRLFGGFGFKIESGILSGVEMGYMLQTVRNSAETTEGRERVNHVLRITLISDLPLRLK